MIKVAVLGYGTVGSGVVEVLEKNRTQIAQKAGEEIAVEYILDLRDFPGDPYEEKVVHDFQTILEDESVRVVCETMGGVGAAYQFSKALLEKGKCVCTSNKELVAKHGAELMAIAGEHHCSYLFEASVGGGIPIIRPLNECLTAERVESVTGILNGTTNYILTRMEREGADFEAVLHDAQKLGYAERNPEADVEGHDACRKIAILTSLVTGKLVDSERIPTKGITAVSGADFAYAKACGRTIKLLASAKISEDGSVEAQVAPCMISKEHPLGMVNDVFNAILVTGNMVGETMYYGRGAGKLPTASAVVGDVVECVRNLGTTVPCGWSSESAVLKQAGEAVSGFFVRVAASEKDRALSLFPKGSLLSAGRGEDVGILTEALSESQFSARLEELGAGALSFLRIL